MRSNQSFIATLKGAPLAVSMMMLAGLVLAALMSVPAHAAMTPTQYVQTNANQGVAILSDSSLSDADRRSKFREFMLGLVDEKRIAMFTLGTYRRDASEADQAAFTDAFIDYAVATYEVRLCKYKGQTLKVTDVTERSPTDYTVTTIVQGNGGGEPIHVGFRLNKDGDNYTVVDIHVEGIWLAISQRDEFTALLKNNNGSVPALTAHVKDLAEKQQSEGCPS